MAIVKIYNLLSVVLFAVLYVETGGTCYSEEDCSVQQVCCKPKYLLANECSDSCVGKSCYTNSDCGGKYCCDDICRESCLGHSCILHSDCGGDNEYCCDYACQKGVCGLAAWVVTVIVLSVLGGIATVVGVALCVYCSYRRRTPGLVVSTVPAFSTVPTTTTSVNAGTSFNYNLMPAQPYDQGPPPYYQPPQAQNQK